MGSGCGLLVAVALLGALLADGAIHPYNKEYFYSGGPTRQIPYIEWSARRPSHSLPER